MNILEKIGLPIQSSYKIKDLVEAGLGHRNTWANLIKSGILPGFKLGTDWRIAKDDLSDYFMSSYTGEKAS